ncbi:hypothetical protein N7491_010993 [Penicillium cf. griseofulvum]|uniref:Extracellular membrane protein CFEM domain-containing protein n=1 Tax=Penicillium cf. griseofulvum TaxID=2972120 RepID=A0A9W9T6C4_9EURO|nr:hypothetical protein N7472_001312 [Penicillium cf. griseofulvum]KAJ5422548.1 hypothetical protein N7491_010993 [Penicillium cf. griseofulvum]KAJ5428725.1 hypothetical protein N7445_010179 [Penicillium cf. griseofulvum]
MRFSPLAILALASVAVADIKTWNDVVGDVPQCIKTCLGEYYDGVGLKDQCGSADKATVDCLCGTTGSVADIQDDASDLSKCMQNGCETSELSDAVSKLQGFQERLEGVYNQCTKEASSNGASSVVPGLNTMLASGALLLVGMAL